MRKWVRALKASLGRSSKPDKPVLTPEVFRRSLSETLGFVKDDEWPLLKELVHKAGTNMGPIIEIGTLFGFSTLAMCTWKKNENKVITVDNYSWNPWRLTPEDHHAFTHLVLRPLILEQQVEQVSMDKDEFYRTYSGERPAMVFLDAIHTYEETRKDIEWAKQVGAHVISGHDYSSEFPGVQQAVDEAGGPAQLCGTIWVL